MKVFGFFLLLITSQVCLAQLKVTKLSKNAVPTGIQYNGHIVNAVRWIDNLGDQIVVATETGEILSKGIDDENYRDAALYAYHFILQGNSWKQTWKVYDL